MRTMQLLRWGSTLATFAVLLAFDVSWPFALMFSSVPFLMVTWAIGKKAKDRHHYYFVMRRLAIMFVLIPTIALTAILAFNSSTLGFILGLPLIALSAWIVIHLGRRRDEKSPQAQHVDFQEQMDLMAGHHLRQERQERLDTIARSKAIDEAVAAQGKASREESMRRVEAEVAAYRQSRLDGTWKPE